MNTRVFAVLGIAAFLATGTATAQDRTNRGARQAPAAMSDDVTQGRVKELTPGRNVVIAVDNAPDKSYDLTNRDWTIRMASGLKVGDPVRVTEREVNGKKNVDIAKHSDTNAQRGADRSAGAADADRNRAQQGDVTYGRIKEITMGRKVVVNVDNALDKSFDLTDRDVMASVESGLKVGDPVMVTERDVNGKKHIDIAMHSDPSVKHGDADRGAVGAADPDRDRADRGDVTYGRIKELTAGQKVVVDVDNAIDKSFSLADRNVVVNIGSGLKVSDPVMVTERDVNGKKHVDIAMHSDPSVKHGDADRSAVGAADADRDRAGRGDVSYGRIKELTMGQKVVVDVDNAVDKSFDLTDRDAVVTVASGLKVGDPVMVTERDVNGKKHVSIAMHLDPSVKHGDADRRETEKEKK